VLLSQDVISDRRTNLFVDQAYKPKRRISGFLALVIEGWLTKSTNEVHPHGVKVLHAKSFDQFKEEIEASLKDFALSFFNSRVADDAHDVVNSVTNAERCVIIQTFYR
jgi:uncharacterized protein YwbE